MTRFSLRAATFEDADLLHAWRNDPLTRQNSLITDPVPFATHCAWLSAVLADDRQALLIAEDAGLPVGTVRYRFDADGTAVLSWTVAPDARGRGIATRMVGIIAEGQLRGQPIRAEIKEGNAASVRVATAAGMVWRETRNGVMSFSRGPL